MMNKILLFALLAYTSSITTYVKADESATYKQKQAAVIRKLTQDTRAIQEYATLGRAQCYSRVFRLQEKHNEVEGFEESDLYFMARTDIANSQSPFSAITEAKALKSHLVNYITSWQKLPYFSNPAYQKVYSINYRETEKCEKMFDANNKNLRQSYLKFIRNTDNYEKPKCSADCNCCTVLPKEIEDKFDNYLKYYIEYVEPDGCPLGKQEWC